MNVFLDTNIVLDLLQNRNNAREAASIIDLGAKGKIKLFITDLSIANIIYIARKDLGKEEVYEVMKRLCSFINIAPMTQSETDRAFALKHPDFEDVLQYFSAVSAKSDYIVTGNKKHFLMSKIPVRNGEEFLNEYWNRENFLIRNNSQ